MPKVPTKAEKLMKLKVNGTAFISGSKPHGLIKTVKVHHPERVFTTEGREGGYLVTRRA